MNLLTNVVWFKTNEWIQKLMIIIDYYVVITENNFVKKKVSETLRPQGMWPLNSNYIMRKGQEPWEMWHELNALEVSDGKIFPKGGNQCLSCWSTLLIAIIMPMRMWVCVSWSTSEHEHAQTVHCSHDKYMQNMAMGYSTPRQPSRLYWWKGKWNQKECFPIYAATFTSSSFPPSFLPSFHSMYWAYTMCYALC